MQEKHKKNWPEHGIEPAPSSKRRGRSQNETSALPTAPRGNNL